MFSKHKTELLVWAPRRAELMAGAPAVVRAAKVELGDVPHSTSALLNISWPSSSTWRTAAATNDWMEITTTKITCRNVGGDVGITAGHSRVQERLL